MLAEVTELHLDQPSNAKEVTGARTLSELGEDEETVELLTSKLDAINKGKELAIEATKGTETGIKQLEVGRLNERPVTDCPLKQMETTMKQYTALADQVSEKQELRKVRDFDHAADKSLKEKQHQNNSEIASMQQLMVDVVAAVSTKCEEDSLGVEFDGYNSNNQTAAEAPGYLSLSSTMATMGPVAISAETTMPATNSVHMVLYDENLICEILIHLVHASNLVRAALVSKSWLATASDPIFLKRFRERHAPCLLGYYIVAERMLHPRFLALVHPPELGTMIRRASSQFDVWVDVPVTIWGCKNGRLLIDICDRLEVRSHLSPPYAIAAYPQSPMKVHLDESFQYQYLEFLPEDGGDGHEYYRMVLGHRGNEIIVYFFLLHGHIWVVRKSEVMALPFSPESSSTPFLAPYGVLGHGMSYVMTSWRLIVAVDIESLELSVVELPKDLSEDYHYFDLCQSQLENSFCLFGLSKTDLRIWVCDLGSSSPCMWSSLHSVSIGDLFGHITIDDITLHGIGAGGISIFAG